MRQTIYLSALLLPLCILCGCREKISNDRKLYTCTNKIKNSQNPEEKIAAWDNALKTSADILKADPGNRNAKLLQAIAYEKHGKYDEALDLANQAAQEYPDDFISLYTCGRLAAEQPLRRQQAFALLQKALVLNPGDVNTLILLCTLGTQLNHPRTMEYLIQLQQRKEYAGSATLSYQFAIYFANKNKKKEAVGFFKQAVSRGTNNPGLIYNTALRVDHGKIGKPDSFYRLFLNVPGVKDPAHTAYAQKRLKELGGR